MKFVDPDGREVVAATLTLPILSTGTGTAAVGAALTAAAPVVAAGTGGAVVGTLVNKIPGVSDFLTKKLLPVAEVIETVTNRNRNRGGRTKTTPPPTAVPGAKARTTPSPTLTPGDPDDEKEPPSGEKLADQLENSEKKGIVDNVVKGVVKLLEAAGG